MQNDKGWDRNHDDAREGKQGQITMRDSRKCCLHRSKGSQVCCPKGEGRIGGSPKCNQDGKEEECKSPAKREQLGNRGRKGITKHERYGEAKKEEK